jgi:orotidine-5'-phosphate decarboxylase
MGFKVFLDLKIHDIPNTARHAAKTITKLGADIINVHAAGGKEMMIGARLGMEEALKENPELERPIIIAVTQLTSTDQNVLKSDIWIDKPLKDTIVHYAKMTKEAGLDGVVCSPLEVKLIKEHIGSDFKCVTPGIRPKGSASQDQKRVTTPKEAFDNGSDYIVVGRAITTAESPRKAFEDIAKEIDS